MIAMLYKHGSGWILGLSEAGWRREEWHATKRSAVASAKKAGAKIVPC